MHAETRTLALTPEEYVIIRTLREMPESVVKRRVTRLMDELVTFARSPQCPELQADGVPCERPSNDCETCQVVAQMLDVLARQIPGHRN